MIVATACLAALPVAPAQQPDPNQQSPTSDGQESLDPASDSSTDESASSEKLPEDFTPPREIPEVMKLTKPLMTEEEEKVFKAKFPEYRSALRNGNLNDKNRNLIREGLRWQLRKLTMEKYADQRHEIVSAIERDIRSAAKLTDNPSAVEEFRRFVLGEVVKAAGELLDNNFYVRLNVVLIVSRLNLKSGNRTEDKPPVAFAPAAKLLLQVVNDEEQLEAIKIPAVKGLKRILRLGQPSNDRKHRIIDTLTEQLAQGGTNWWYQMRLAEALTAGDVLYDRQGDPVIVQTLANVLVDGNRHWMVRAEAAKSLGRVPVNGTINAGLLAFEMARLGRQMADHIQQSPEAAYWRICYFKLYLAFRPLNAEEQQRQAGLMTKVEQGSFGSHRQTIEQAYAHLLPLVRMVLNADSLQTFTDNAQEQLTEFDQWLQDNQPEDLRVAPGQQPIARQPVSSQSVPDSESDSAEPKGETQQTSAG